MTRIPITFQLTSALFVIGLLVACIPGEQPPSPEEIAAQVETSVAMTVEAQGQIGTSVALTVAARETEAAGAIPTATLTPTGSLPTLTPILPTATPFTISGGGGGGGGGGGSTTYAYSCDIIRQRPLDNTEFRRSHTFDVTFTILNNGTATWEAGKDLTLLEDHGVLSPPFTFLELPKMEPGDTFKVGPFNAAAPDTAGHYVIDFKLEGGFCYPYVAFDVIR